MGAVPGYLPGNIPAVGVAGPGVLEVLPRRVSPGPAAMASRYGDHGMAAAAAQAYGQAQPGPGALGAVGPGVPRDEGGTPRQIPGAAVVVVLHPALPH